MPLGRLYVEGVNDLHFLKNLLARHGIDARKESDAGPDHVEIVARDGFEKMVAAVGPDVKSRSYPIGFVADADPAFGLQQRWTALTGPMFPVVSGIPSSAPPEGWVHATLSIGIWLMPDNIVDGKLEDFLRQIMLAGGGALWDHAVQSTEESFRHGALFKEVDRKKAEVQAFLAWQNPPGLRYGEAVSKGCFDHDADLATRFVSWFRRLYRI